MDTHHTYLNMGLDDFKNKLNSYITELVEELKMNHVMHRMYYIKEEYN